jgi:hypothetical protein
MMMGREKLIAGIVTLVLLGACGESSQEAATTNPGGAGNAGGSGGSSGTGGAGGALDASRTDAAPEAGASDSLSGTWKGYVENYKFHDDSDAVVLTIVGGVISGDVGGQATFGMSMPPPPVSDPNVGYPPGLDLVAGGGGLSQGPYPGFAFTMMKPSFAGQRLQFDIASAELWKSWCEKQAPILDEANAGGQYWCVHNWGFKGGANGCSQPDPMTHQDVPIDCGKLALCAIGGGVCSCTMQACTSNTDTGIHFDMVVAPPKADGSVMGLDGNVHNVHLMKQ